MTRRTLGITTVQVLHAVSAGSRYGFDIMDGTGLPSGTVYPALSRLERRGLVRARWEDARVARREKRPARKYHEITDEGRARLSEAADRLLRLERDLPRDLRGLKPAAG